MNFEAGIILTILAAMLMLIFLVLMNGNDKRINKVYVLFILSLIGWIIPNYLLDFMGLYKDAFWLLWLSRLALLMPIFAFWSLVYFSFLFPKTSKNLSEKTLKLFAIPVAFMVPLVFTSFNISRVVASADRNNVIVETGPLYIVFIVYVAVCLGLSIFLLLSKRKSLEKTYQKQINTVLVGIVLSAFFAVVLNIVLLYFGTNVSYIGPISLVFFIGFATYAIIKHQMFDIKVILTETIVGILILVLLVQTFLSKNVNNAVINGGVLFTVAYGGYLIIKSVLNEIKQKEQLQVISVQLAEANTHLKDLDKMKTEFVSLASHELLTPVSAIEGYLSMMLDEKLVTLEDPKAVQYMDRVYRSAKRLARLIADMLNISRIEEGRLAVEKKDVDMTETIKQVLEELKFKADEHKQKIVFAGQNTNNQHMTYGDPDKIKEILVNIIGNSIKYTMNPGTITVTLEKVPTRVLTSKWDKMEAAIMTQPVDNQESIHAVADEHMKKILGDEQYLIRIKDEGIGIPKDELPKLFRKFHRVGDFSTAESQGTGLGLYITRALVELHHGRVWPDSEGQGKGSTFTFSLPTYDAKKEIIALEAQTPQTKEQLKPLAKPMSNDDAL